jgi:hypothetical protein
MTKDAAVITGTFADFKLIKTRSTAQLVIEVPIEQADRALLALGGIPQPGRESSVAVARLDIKKVKPFERPGKRQSLAQKAALLCGDEDFRKFLSDALPHSGVPQDADEAAAFVRELCQVESRSEFDSDPEAGQRWLELEAQFTAWLDR